MIYVEWGSEFHMDCKEALEKAWKRKVSPILEDMKLYELTVNLSDACCPHRCCNCCKMYLRALWPFQPGFAHELEHKDIKFIGIEDPFNEQYINPAVGPHDDNFEGQLRSWTEYRHQEDEGGQNGDGDQDDDRDLKDYGDQEWFTEQWEDERVFQGW